MKRTVVILYALAAMVLSVQATMISDPAEALGWTTISGGYWASTAGELLPVESNKFFTAGGFGGSNRGTWKLFGETFTEEILKVSFWMGEYTTTTGFPDTVTATLFADVNANGLWEFDEQILPHVSSNPIPSDAWEQWVNLYNITADTKTTGGSNVLGSAIGFYVRVAGDGAGKSFAFDSLNIETMELTPSDNLLIAWDGGILTNTAYVVDGLSGTLFANLIYSADASAGSTDWTFGSSTLGADPSPAAYAVRTANLGSNNTVSVQIHNTSTEVVQLDTLSFDYSPWFSDGPTTVTMSYAYGDLSGVPAETVLNSAGGIAATGKFADYSDFDWSLTGLADRRLAPGERATFTLVATEATGAYVNGAFDNIALFGSVEVVGYDAWAEGWDANLGAATDDYDGDGLNNLGEYGLGGDPTDGSDRGIAPGVGVETVDGTDWFGYVYPQRADLDSGLSYRLELCTNLVYGAWTNTGYAVLGTNITGGEFDYVTNVTDMVSSEKFIRLIVE